VICDLICKTRQAIVKSCVRVFCYCPCVIFTKSYLCKNPEDKREINCDELLSRVMGGESKVTMFSMNKYM
jgi:hypothetical protein